MKYSTNQSVVLIATLCAAYGLSNAATAPTEASQVSASGVAPSSVIADQSVTLDNSSAKYYVSLDTGIAIAQNLPTGEWTGNLNVGYNYTQYLAVELGYALMSGTQYGATTSSNIFDVAVKGTLSVYKAFDLYGRAGFGFGINGSSGDVVWGI